jgi:hypothetical protein
MEKSCIQIFAGKPCFPRFVMPKRFFLKEKIIQGFFKQNFLIKREIRKRILLYKVKLMKRDGNSLLDIPKLISIPRPQSRLGGFKVFG